jgi:competence protein ComEC
MKVKLETLANLQLLWVALAFLGGILLGGQIVLPVNLWLILAALGLAAGLILQRVNPKSAWLIALLPFFLFLGAARYQAAQPTSSPENLLYYNDYPGKIWITGSLTAPPDVRDSYQNLRVKVQSIDFGDGDLPIQGNLLIRAHRAEDLRYGDLIRVRGWLTTPAESETFSYRDYLALYGIHSSLSANKITVLPLAGESNPFMALMYQLKASLTSRIYLLFPDPEASLLNGILLGNDNSLAPPLQQAFKNTGTSHIIAISGFNIAIIAVLFVGFFSKLFGKNIGPPLAILGIAGYTLLVGAEASVVRAAIMGTLSILAAQLGRRNVALNALAFVAVSMAAINPLVLQDVGFQLSFAATLGLVLYAQPLQDYTAAKLRRLLPASTVESLIGPLSNYFLMTLAAQLTTLPIIAYHFGRISIVSLLINPIILPAQPPVMIVGGLAVLASHIHLPLGKLLAALAWPFPAYTIRMVELFDKIPGGVIVLGEFNLLVLIASYALLFGLTLAWPQFQKTLIKALKPATLLTGLAVLVFLLWRTALSAPDGRLHLTFLNVGSGDAILIQTPTGRELLINGGPSPSRLADQLGRRLAPFDRSLDYLVIASPQENQVAALPIIIERFIPRNVLWSGDTIVSYSAQKLNEWVTLHQTPATRAEIGQQIDLGQGATLRVLQTSPRGLILLVEWKTFRAILPVGVDFDAFQALNYGREIGPVTALLVSESGYTPANPPAWFLNLSPQIFILSVAGNDANGLPEPDLLALLEDQTVLRTDHNGWIKLSTNGDQLWVEVERK